MAQASSDLSCGWIVKRGSSIGSCQAHCSVLKNSLQFDSQSSAGEGDLQSPPCATGSVRCRGRRSAKPPVHNRISQVPGKAICKAPRAQRDQKSPLLAGDAPSVSGAQEAAAVEETTAAPEERRSPGGVRGIRGSGRQRRQQLQRWLEPRVAAATKGLAAK